MPAPLTTPSAPPPLAPRQDDIHVLRVTQAFDQISQKINEAIAKVTAVLTELAPAFTRFADFFRQLPEALRAAWTEAAVHGWYPNSRSEMAPLEPSKPELLDAHMIAQLRRDWFALTEELLQRHPERAHILKCAFALHTTGEYIASIPLFLSQADGIAATILKAHLFTEHEQREAKLQALLAGADDFTSVLLHILGAHTQFHERIGKDGPSHKARAPNRNGILHGSRRHLDYGTEVNSFKAFSLLAFVSLALEPFASPSIESQ